MHQKTFFFIFISVCFLFAVGIINAQNQVFHTIQIPVLPAGNEVVITFDARVPSDLARGDRIGTQINVEDDSLTTVVLSDDPDTTDVLQDPTFTPTDLGVSQLPETGELPLWRIILPGAVGLLSIIILFAGIRLRSMRASALMMCLVLAGALYANAQTNPPPAVFPLLVDNLCGAGDGDTFADADEIICYRLRIINGEQDLNLRDINLDAVSVAAPLTIVPNSTRIGEPFCANLPEVNALRGQIGRSPLDSLPCGQPPVSSPAPAEPTGIPAPVSIDASVTDDVAGVTVGASNTVNILANDSGDAPLTALQFADDSAFTTPIPADGVTPLSISAGAGTLEITLDSSGNLTIDATTATGSGTVTIYYQIEAGNGTTDTGQIDITYGDFPTASDDTLANGVTFTTSAGTTFNSGSTGYQSLLTNDTPGTPAATLVSFGDGDLAGDASQFTAPSSQTVAKGTLTILDSAGNFEFTPAAGFTGIFTFNYRLDNGVGFSDGTVEIYVEAAPDAIADTYQVSLGTVDSGNNVLTNDDPGAPPAQVDAYADTGDIGGTSSIAAGGTYTHPTGNFDVVILADGSITIDASAAGVTQGTYTFDYQITNSADSDIATITVEIVEGPVAEDDTFTVVLGNDLSGDLTADNGAGADTAGTPPFDVLTFGGGDLGGTVTSNTATPGGTSVSLAGGTLTITDAGSISLTGATVPGLYTFNYRLESTTLGFSDDATVTIEVLSLPVAVDDGTNAAPAYTLALGNTLSEPAATGVRESNDDYTLPNVYDDAVVDGYGTVFATTPGNPFTITGSGGVTVTLDAAGAITIDATAGTTFSGTYSFDYRISNTAGSSTATVFFLVTEGPIAEDDIFTVNFDDASPVINGDLTAANGVAPDEPGSPPFTTLTFGGGDLGGTVTSNTATSGGTSVSLAGGTLTITDAGSITLTNPGTLTPGQYTFDYRLNNGIATDDATVTIDIYSPPTAVDDAVTVSSGGSVTEPAATGLRNSNDDYTLPNVYDDAVVDGYGTGFTTTPGNPFAVSGTGATITIAADGGFTVDATSATTGGIFTVDYRITNSYGSDAAIVTITIQSPPDGFDDSSAAVLGGTSAPGDPFHVAANSGTVSIGNLYVDNGGFGADNLGIPSAPTDAPADIIDTIALASTPDDAATGSIGGGAFTFGGGAFTFGSGGTIDVATNGDLDFAPPGNFTGLVTFDYTLANSIGTDTTPATVTIAVGARPVCTNDTYTATGNISISTTNVAGNSVLVNDDGDLRTVTQVQGGANVGTDTATTSGGTVNMTADGEFAYEPPVGFTGDDTFTYAITNGFGQSTSCTVTITVSNLIYFMDSAAASGGDGSLANPYSNPADHNGAPPVANSALFIEDNGVVYNGSMGLVSGQRVIGEGSTPAGTLDTVLGITFAPLSDPIPYTTTGNAADWAQFTNPAGTGFLLDVDNTLSGLDIGNTQFFGINALNNAGTLTISETQIIGTGGTMTIQNGGTLDVAFTTLSTTSSIGDAFNINGGSGTVDVATTNFSGVGTNGIDIINSGVTANFGSTSINAPSADAIFLSNNTGNFSLTNSGGIIAGNGDAIFAQNHAGAVTMVSGGGGLTATQGACANIFGTSVTTLNVNVQSCSATAALPNGIRLENVAGSQFVVQNATNITVAGSGSEGIRIANATVGLIDISAGSTVTITNRRGTGVLVDNYDGGTLNMGNVTDTNNAAVAGYGLRIANSTSPATLDQANIRNALVGTAQTQSAGFPVNDGDGDNIFLKDNPAPFSFTVNGGLIRNAGGDNIDGRNTHSVRLNNVTIDEATGIQVSLYNSPGTHEVNNSLIEDFGAVVSPPLDGHGYLLRNSGVNANLVVNGSTFRADIGGATVGGIGLLVEARAGSVLDVDVIGSSVFENIFGFGAQIVADGGTSNTLVENSTFRNSNGTGSGALVVNANNGGSHTHLIQNNTFQNLGQLTTASGILAASSFNNATMVGTIIGNTLTNTVRNMLQVQTETNASTRLRITDNVFDDLSFTTSDNRAAMFLASSGANSVDFDIRNNRIGQTTAVDTEGIVLLGNPASGVRAQISNNQIGGSVQMRGRGIGLDLPSAGNYELTINNNTINAGSLTNFFRRDIQIETETTASACVNATGNTLLGDGDFGLENFGMPPSFEVSNYANASAVAAANNSANVITSGTLSFGARSCTLPSGPYN